MRVLQVVPRLRPEVCGVGDYASDLAKELRARHGIDTEFLVGNPKWAHSDEVSNFRVHAVESRSPASMFRAVERTGCDAVVLQYSGYGFHKRGAPVWLPRGLRGVTRPLLTMFHELYATGPATSSAFWLSPVMRVVARKLAALSQHVLTNREASARWLTGDVAVLPVFSSMGETPDPGPLAEREPWLALFGYQALGRPWYWERLRHVVDILKPSRVIALGRTGSNVKQWCGTVPCEETGLLPASAVSDWLRQCRFGYYSYNPDFVGKSGILAAYLAHGLCTVLADDTEHLSEGLRPGYEVLSAKHLTAASDCEAVAAAGHTWYRPHSRAATADAFARRLREMAQSPR